MQLDCENMILNKEATKPHKLSQKQLECSIMSSTIDRCPNLFVTQYIENTEY